MKKSLLLLLSLATLAGTALAAPTQEAAPEEETGGYEFREEEEIQAALEQVLGGGEFRILERSREKPEEPKPKEEKESEARGWLGRLIEWLLDKLTPDSEEVRPTQPTETSPLVFAVFAVMRLILIGLAAGVLVTVIALILKAVLKRAPNESKLSAKAKAEQVETATPPGELPSDEYVARAVSLADSGNYKAAVRQLLLGTMSWIERHGLIRYRRGLSNRDYLRAVFGRTGQRESLRPIVLHFEQVYFGRREATSAGFQECLKHFRKAFSTD